MPKLELVKHTKCITQFVIKYISQKKDRENSQILFYPVTTSQRESKKKTKRKKNCVEHK